MNSDYRILVAIDLKPGTDRLLAEARRYAKALGAMVDIIHVAPPDPTFVGYIKGTEGDAPIDSERQSHAQDLRTEHHEVQALAAGLRDSGVPVHRALMVQGPTLEIILEEARRFGTDMLMLGAHHHGALYRLWYGDVATDAAKRAPCAVLVVPIHD